MADELLFKKEIGHNEYLCIHKGMFRSTERIDIRMWTLSRGQSQMRPTPRGVSIPMNRFRDFQDAVASIKLPGSVPMKEPNNGERQDVS